MLPQAAIPCSRRAHEPTAENKASHFQTFRRLWLKPLTTTKTPRRQKCHLGVLVEATGFAPLAARPRRSKANFAGVRLWQTPRFHRLPLLFPQIFCYAKSLREPCHQPTGLFSLRRADLSTNNSRANRLLPQTPPPSKPCHIRVTQNGERKTEPTNVDSVFRGAETGI